MLSGQPEPKRRHRLRFQLEPRGWNFIFLLSNEFLMS